MLTSDGFTRHEPKEAVAGYYRKQINARKPKQHNTKIRAITAKTKVTQQQQKQQRKKNRPIKTK